MQAIMIAMQLTVGVGGDIVVLSPAWPNFAGSAIIEGAGVTYVALDHGEAGWMLDLDKLFDSCGPKTKALVINSPGGSPVPSTLIAKRIRDLASEKDVPVVAFVEDVAASGGYWLALAADEIFVQSPSIVGSIGVISAGFGFPGLLEKMGVERRVHTSGERKAMLDPFSAEKPDD